MNKSPILCYDTEVSQAVVSGYGNKWDFKVVKFIRPQQLMCYAYKWVGEKKTHYVSRHDFKTYKAFVQSLADLLNSAPIVVAHNAVDFDNKMSNTFFVTEGIDAPRPFKTIDTLKVARSVFKFPSNSLKDLAEFLGIGHKESITYASLEDDFMTDRPSLRTKRLMKRYTVKDVDLLEKIYLIERPFMKTHPNMAAYTGNKFACPRCGSPDFLQKRGKRIRGMTEVQEFACLNVLKDGTRCGAWPTQRLADKGTERPELV